AKRIVRSWISCAVAGSASPRAASSETASKGRRTDGTPAVVDGPHHRDGGKAFQYGKHLAVRLRSVAMTAQLERGLAVLKHLAAHPEGAALSNIAATMAMPLSAAHRLLSELVKSGY